MVAVLGALVFAANCGEEITTLDDAGGVIGDAAAAMDAAGPASIETACTEESVYVQRASGVAITTTEWRTSVEWTRSTPPRVVLCGHECFGLQCPQPCPEGYACEGTRAQPQDCITAVAFSANLGRLSVSCGQRYRIDWTDPMEVDSDSGWRYNRVIVME